MAYWEVRDKSTDTTSVGVLAVARMEDERSGNTGSPVDGVRTHQLVIREEWTGLAVWRIGP